MIKYSIVVCCYGKILVNVAAYVIVVRCVVCGGVCGVWGVCVCGVVCVCVCGVCAVCVCVRCVWCVCVLCVCVVCVVCVCVCGVCRPAAKLLL